MTALGVNLKRYVLPKQQGILTDVKELWALDEDHWFAIRLTEGRWCILLNCGSLRRTVELDPSCTHTAKRKKGMELIGEMIDNEDLLDEGFISPSDQRFPLLFPEFLGG